MAPPPAKEPPSFGRLPTAGKAALVIPIVALLGAVYYLVFYMGVEEEIQTARSARTRLDTQMEEAEERERQFIAKSEELDQRRDADRRNKRILPERAYIDGFLQDLNRIAETSGLHIATVEPRPEEAQEQYVRIPVQLELRGRFHGLAKFFHGVSQLDRAISMEDIKLNEPTVQGEEVQLEVSVMASTYRTPDAPAAAPAGGAAARPATAPGR